MACHATPQNNLCPVYMLKDKEKQSVLLFLFIHLFIFIRAWFVSGSLITLIYWYLASVPPTPPRLLLNKLIVSCDMSNISRVLFLIYFPIHSLLTVVPVCMCVVGTVHLPFLCLSLNVNWIFDVKTGNCLMDVWTVLSLQRSDKKFNISEDRNASCQNYQYARMCVRISI